MPCVSMKMAISPRCLISALGGRWRRAGGAPLGTLYLGEDVPADWGQLWDIDSDMEAKMRPVTRLLSRETVSDGAVEMRIRAKYALGEEIPLSPWIPSSTLEDPRVDFHLLVDWQEKHALLKVGFDVDISASMARPRNSVWPHRAACYA